MFSQDGVEENQEACDEIIRRIGRNPDEVLCTDESSWADFIYSDDEHSTVGISAWERRCKIASEKLGIKITRDMTILEILHEYRKEFPKWPNTETLQ